MSFEEFNLAPECLDALTKQGITVPTPVQAQAIPVALEGVDLICLAQTGTGKTFAFSLPSITRLAADTRGRNRMLVLTPTRELAVQVHKAIQPIAHAVRLRTLCVYGGVGMEPQTKGLRRGSDIIIATPGRLLDHMERGNVRFPRLSILVLDEADRMLDMGFLPDVRRILDEINPDRQTMMFSATFPKEISRLATEFQRDPQRIEVGPVATPTEAVSQHVYTVDPGAKTKLLTQILKRPEVKTALVFSRTKHGTDRIVRQLHKSGFKAQAIHGGRTQSNRQKALEGFRKGRFNILVATDVAARGIDVQGITHVVNFDIPKSYDDYVHRIGRTARANAKGDAITFVSPHDFQELGAIEKQMGKNIPQVEWEGAVRVPSLFRPKSPAKRRTGSVRRGRRPRRFASSAR